MFNVKLLFLILIVSFLFYVVYVYIFKKDRVPFFVELFFFSVLFFLLLLILFPKLLVLIISLLDMSNFISVIVYLGIFFAYLLIYMLYVNYSKLSEDIGRFESEIAIQDFEICELRKIVSELLGEKDSSWRCFKVTSYSNKDSSEKEDGVIKKK